MADAMNVGVNLEAFSQAINAIQALRSSVTRVFDSLKDGMKNKETLEGREKVFITEFQDNLQSVNRDLNELERLSTLVGRPSESHPLHNSGLLSLDPVQDKTPLYSQLLQAYKWSNKLQYHAGLASSLLNQQSLKRSANQMGASAKRRPKVQPSTLVLPPQYVDDVISRIGRMFPDMSIELFRPNGTSAVLLVTLGKVLKAIVVMRSLFIDRTIVRGFSENVYSEDGKQEQQAEPSSIQREGGKEKENCTIKGGLQRLSKASLGWISGQSQTIRFFKRLRITPPLLCCTTNFHKCPTWWYGPS
ncbi:mediator of RNA polymerase II transcription subunit 27 isoform X3 [Salmo trutta]|uniref:mediator of RNA polymerase II transcription subunit 27 isoform X3 n=1 Tax=Salmo trutta TaxID=8032 RepID=UPI00113178C3|nr:mediator of RNA polymerase II transcription subunit 27 isoform X3 [Salmo trutta]